MTFVKGKSGNPGGRPKGAVNIRSQQWEALGESMTGKFADAVEDHMQSLLDKKDYDEFMKHYKDFTNYFKPKLASTQVKQQTEHSIGLSDEELTAKLNKILESFSQE